MTHSRRYDLDWLRVIAFTILIYFHAAIIFIPGGLPLIQNLETSPLLGLFVDFSHQFRLALLFLISGAGVGFAKRHRKDNEFIIERCRRLLIPLLVGIIFVVPPMVYAKKLFLGVVDSSFRGFYPTFLPKVFIPRAILAGIISGLSLTGLFFVCSEFGCFVTSMQMKR